MNTASMTRDRIVAGVASHAEAWASAPKVYLAPTNAAVVVKVAAGPVYSSLTLSYTPVVAFVPEFLQVNGQVASTCTFESLVLGADPSIFSGPIPASVFAAGSFQEAAYFNAGPVSAAVPISLGTTNRSLTTDVYVTAAIGGRRLDRLAYAAQACGQ